MRFQEIFDKWGIDPKKYETWYDKSSLIDLFDAYKETHFLTSYTQLAKAIGVPQRSLGDVLQKDSKVGIAVMVRYIDAMGIDPKKYLTPVTANTNNVHKAGPMRAEKKRKFLAVFSDADEWEFMIEHADEIRKFMGSIKKLS